MAEAEVPFEARADKSLLIVDDDKPFSTRLARAMEGRGYAVRVADTVAEGLAAVETSAPITLFVIVVSDDAPLHLFLSRM